MSFRASVTDSGEDARRVVLDQTAFYPTSGGQPHDVGTINRVAVEDVIDDGERIVHLLAAPVWDSEVEGEIDWHRRFDHMQQHSGQHLLSAVVADLFGFETVSFHLGTESSTIDLRCASIGPDQLRSAEAEANAVVQQNRLVSVVFEDASEAKGLRKPSDRTGLLRVITIEGLDRSACGGTHVHATGEIGAILLRSVEKIRGNVRLEFLCGRRAIKLKATDKIRRRLETELAEHRGRNLYAQTAPDASGRRVHSRVVRGGGLPEDIRAEATAFVSEGRSVFIAVSETPSTVLVASSPDSGIHSGTIVKGVVAEFGGKGGGAANLAQGSFTGDPARFLERLLAELTA
jgi:alanyl-tRNA synthetase